MSNLVLTGFSCSSVFKIQIAYQKKKERKEKKKVVEVLVVVLSLGTKKANGPNSLECPWLPRLVT